MTTSHFLIELLGATALLLWGMGMIRGGVLRLRGRALRHMIGRGLGSRWTAVPVGAVAAFLLQGGVAATRLVASFPAGGRDVLVSALAVLLGAVVGAALLAQLLVALPPVLSPVLVLCGLVLYRRGRFADAAPAVVGAGLVLLALALLAGALGAPSARSAIVLLAPLLEAPLLVGAAAAATAWVARSGVAVVLVAAVAGGVGILPPEAVLAIVLGAGVGGAAVAVSDLLRSGGDRLRVALGGLMCQAAGALLAAPFVPFLAERAAGWDAGRLAVDAYLALALGLAAVGSPLLPWIARAAVALLPDRSVDRADPGAPRYLDRSALAEPAAALSNAAREILHMADIVETMLLEARQAFHGDDRDRVDQIRRTDDAVDRLYNAVQRYLAAVSLRELDDAESARLAEMLPFAVNLEHIGDVIDKNLMELARKRIEKRYTLPPAAMARIDDMLERLVDHLKLAVTVFMNEDLASARRLVEGKEQFREFERSAAQFQLEQMRHGAPQAVETASIQLDIVRDLKRIEAHIAAMAYPLLERTGDLRRSRLAPE